MKVKISITLSEELVARLDSRVGPSANRSALIERAVSAYLVSLDLQERELRDIEIINRHAERLNREAEDVLEFQGQ